MLLRLFVAVVFVALVAVPDRAAANCSTGGAPDYSDVTSIEIDRCQATNTDYPCYHAIFAGAGPNSIDGFLIAYRLHGRSGQYTVRTAQGSEWDQMVQLVRQADFFRLQITDAPLLNGITAVVRVDYPRNQIMVTRCHTHLAIDGDGYYDEKSAAWNRFMGLVEHLSAIVDALPWQRKSDQRSMGDVERYFLP